MSERELLDAAERALGARIEESGRVGGGDINDAWALLLEGGGRAFLKSRAGAPEHEFGAEAAGLRWLGEPGGLPVPEVLAVIDEGDLRGLVLEWVERGGRADDEELGRGLATTHAAGADAFDALPPDSPRTELRFGGGEVESFGGDTWAEVYAARLQRLVRAAFERGAISERCGGLVEDLCERMDDLAGPDERPARVHGDLWSGNVIAGSDGRSWLIDPKAHGAHREMDLAMLDLFGSVSTRTLGAYSEVWPLDAGRGERVGLWQLQPLLVHAILFGGSYGSAVEQTAALYA